MKTEINLAIKRKKTSILISTAKVKKLRLFALIFLFAVGGLSAVLFLIIASSPLPSLRVQEKEAVSTLGNYQVQFGKYLLIKDQLASIQKLLDSRPDLSPSIDIFLSLIPPEVTVSSVAFTETTLSFGVTTHSLSALESFFAAVKEKAERNDVPPSVATSPISYNPGTGEYGFTIDFK